MAVSATCPECGNKVAIEDGSEVGDMMECDSCGTQLEVASLNPPRVEEMSSDDV